MNEAEKAVMDALLPHMVAMCGTYRYVNEEGEPYGPRRFYSYTGCVFKLDCKVLIATAGHVLDIHEKRSKNPSIRVESEVLVTFGSNGLPLGPIPFYPLSRGTIRIDDDGLDMGLVEVGELYQAGMEVDGVVPFHPQQWKGSESQAFEGYAVLGFADENSAKELAEGEAGHVIPSLIPLSKVDDDSGTLFERFKGEIVDMGSQLKVEGMSGGPIIGFYRENGALKYRLIAIQSSAFGRSASYGCPVSTFMNLVAIKLQQYREEQQSQSSVE